MEANEMHYFPTLFGKELYMFRTVLLSLISTADSNTTSTRNTYCCEYSNKIPDDEQ